MKNFIILFINFFLLQNCFSQSLLPRKTNTIMQQRTSTMQSAIKKNNNTPNQATQTVDSASAGLSHQYFSLLNGTGKPANIHWTCVLYDQNNRQVASFSDKNNDQYSAGSQTASIDLQTDNSSTYNDFQKGGKLVITISSSTNVTWKINDFNLGLDFINPNFTIKYDWTNIEISSNKKQIELSLIGHRKNPTMSYDVKANKAS